MKLKTCATCENLTYSTMDAVRVYGCAKTRKPVPQSSTLESNGSTFWRIPTNCPRPDDEVVKSDERADESDWESIEW